MVVKMHTDKELLDGGHIAVVRSASAKTSSQLEDEYPYRKFSLLYTKESDIEPGITVQWFLVRQLL